MKNYKKTCVKTGVLLLLIVCLLVLPMGTAFADGQTVTGQIQISHSFQKQNGYEPSAGTECTYKVSPLDSSYPAPDGADANGDLLLKFKGLGTAEKTISITFDRTGIYEYRVEPVIKKAYQNYVYDETVYLVSVYVVNEGDGLSAVVTIENDNGDKCESLSYENYYWVKYNPQTGDENSVMLWAALMLLCLTAAVSTVAYMRKRNRWHS